MAAKLSEDREFSMIIPGPYRKKAVNTTHDEEESNKSLRWLDHIYLIKRK